MTEYRVGRGAVIDWTLPPTGHALQVSPQPPGRWELVARGLGRVVAHYGARQGSSGTTATDLALSDSSHQHFADALTLTTSAVLAILDAAHAHGAENITLEVAGATTLAVADATHAHAVDAPMLYTDWLLAVADATHGHAAENVVLSAGPALAPADASHGQTADVLVLTVAAYLTVQQATHSHRADAIVLGGDFGSEPWPLLAARGASAHGHGRARPEQLSTATRSNVQ